MEEDAPLVGGTCEKCILVSKAGLKHWQAEKEGLLSNTNRMDTFRTDRCPDLFMPRSLYLYFLSMVPWLVWNESCQCGVLMRL